MVSYIEAIFLWRHLLRKRYCYSTMRRWGVLSPKLCRSRKKSDTLSPFENKLKPYVVFNTSKLVETDKNVHPTHKFLTSSKSFSL